MRINAGMPSSSSSGSSASFLVLAGSLGWLKPGVVLIFLSLFLIFGWRTGLEVFRWLKDIRRAHPKRTAACLLFTGNRQRCTWNPPICRKAFCEECLCFSIVLRYCFVSSSSDERAVFNWTFISKCCNREAVSLALRSSFDQRCGDQDCGNYPE